MRRPEDLQIGVGLDRVSKQKIHASEGRLDPSIRGFDHAGVVYVQGRTEFGDQIGNPVLAGPQLPVDAGKGLSHGHVVLIGVSTLSPTRPPW